jgi:hypothetical protein
MGTTLADINREAGEAVARCEVCDEEMPRGYCRECAAEQNSEE